MQNELGGARWRLEVNSGPDEARRKKNRKKQSVSQTIDLVVAIKTHTESSKSELSSGGRRPVKVWEFGSFLIRLISNSAHF